VPILLLAGVIALLVGSLGAYANYRALALHGGSADEAPRVLRDGSGRAPSTPGQQAALLCVPLYMGAAVLGECLVWSGFLIVFGGREPEPVPAPGRRRAKAKS
jgi:hypothetical protein